MLDNIIKSCINDQAGVVQMIFQDITWPPGEQCLWAPFALMSLTMELPRFSVEERDREGDCGSVSGRSDQGYLGA